MWVLPQKALLHWWALDDHDYNSPGLNFFYFLIEWWHWYLSFAAWNPVLELQKMARERHLAADYIKGGYSRTVQVGTCLCQLPSNMINPSQLVVKKKTSQLVLDFLNLPWVLVGSWYSCSYGYFLFIYRWYVLRKVAQCSGTLLYSIFPSRNIRAT